MLFKGVVTDLGLTDVEVLVTVVDDAVFRATCSDETQTLKNRQDNIKAVDPVPFLYIALF